MARRTPSTAIPLPRHWSDHVRAGVLHAISLAATSLTAAWSRAAVRRPPNRHRADLDRLRAEITHLQEEMAIKDIRDA